MHLSTWLLEHYGQEQMRPGLSRMREAIKEILPLFERTKVVTIAGTNGKGETTFRLASLLQNHSFFVWTSPHVLRVSERMRSQEGEISEDLLFELILLCHQKAKDQNICLSYYEFLFFVFCTWAAQNPPEYLLLEVGLGGRLDAVNVFDADVVLLPSISRDHQEILGKRYDQILSEKLGVLRPQTVFFHFLQSNYLAEKARKISDEKGAKVFALKDELNVPEYEFSLRNFFLARAAFSHLTGEPVKNEVSLEGLPHRGEVLSGENEWIIFGSHNVDGVRKLIQFLTSGTYTFKRPPFDGILVSFSRRDPHDLRVMLKMLTRARLGKVYVTVFDHPKAAPVNMMETISREEGLEFVRDIKTFMEELPPGQTWVATGSYYFLGHLRSLGGLG